MKYIFFRLLAVIITTALFMSAAFAQQKGKQPARPAIPGVAVINFTNNSGDASLLTLSSSLPEAISASISGRDYLLTTGALHLNIIPFESMRYFTPYFGGFVEAGWLSASHKVNGDWQKEDYDKNGTQFLWGVGGTAGIKSNDLSL